MIGILSLGLLATMVCLALQVVASVLAVRYFAHVAKRPPGPTPRGAIFLEFSILMFGITTGLFIAAFQHAVKSGWRPIRIARGIQVRVWALFGRGRPADRESAFRSARALWP